MSDSNNLTVSMKCSQELKDKLDQWESKGYTSRSEMIRVYLKQKLQEV